jgi:hypothetical protein
MWAVAPLDGWLDGRYSLNFAVRILLWFILIHYKFYGVCCIVII